MTFEEKINLAHQELEAAGIRKSRFNPPLIRFLRKAGLKIPPPHYWKFWTHFLDQSFIFGTVWGTFMWFFVWRPENISSGVAAVTSLSCGILFGLTMALFFRTSFKKYHLSKWEDIGD